MNGLRGVLLLAAIGAAVAYVVTHSDWARLAWEPTAVAESDYELHWAAGRALDAGLDPYDAQVVNGIGLQTGRPNTPFCAANPLVVRLFGMAGPDLAAGYRTWRTWNIVLLAASVLVLASCLVKAIGPRIGIAVALAVALALIALNDGTWMSFFYNQTNVVTLLAVLLALRAAQARQPEVEGVLLAVAAVAKTSPALLLFVAALSGRWRTVLAGLVAGALLVGLSLQWNGVEVHKSYLEMLGLRLGYASQVPGGQFNNSLHDWNLAPNGLLSRAGEAGGWSVWRTMAAAGVVSALVLGSLRRRMRARGERPRPDVLQQYACGIAATFLLSSVTWPTHLSLAAVPCAFFVASAWTSRSLGAGSMLLLGVGALASLVLFLPLGTFGSDAHQHYDILLKADACLALFAVTLASSYQPPTAAPSTGRTKASEGLTPSRR
jgi:hypothetical protein